MNYQTMNYETMELGNYVLWNYKTTQIQNYVTEQRNYETLK